MTDWKPNRQYRRPLNAHQQWRALEIALRDVVIGAVREALFPIKHQDSTRTQRAKQIAKARKYRRIV
jgi:hypothetical protein